MSDPTPVDVLATALRDEIHVDEQHGFPRDFTPWELATLVQHNLRAAGYELVRADSRPALSKYVAALAIDCRSSGMEDCGKVLDGLADFIDAAITEAPE